MNLNELMKGVKKAEEQFKMFCIYCSVKRVYLNVVDLHKFLIKLNYICFKYRKIMTRPEYVSWEEFLKEVEKRAGKPFADYRAENIIRKGMMSK